ncbi:hypothetical protein WBK31_27020 [Nonomuraea sp. N2-4H]
MPARRAAATAAVSATGPGRQARPVSSSAGSTSMSRSPSPPSSGGSSEPKNPSPASCFHPGRRSVRSAAGGQCAAILRAVA